MNNILDEGFNKCTGCQLCAAVCSKNAIEIVVDDEGFYRPVVNGLCVSCGLCKKNCYRFSPIENLRKPVKCFAAYNNDSEILKNSSSGGVSDALMKALIAEGYSIVGVKYDYDEDMACHGIAKSEAELEQFRGSKYMQSHTLDALKTIIASNHEKYAFFGTPCQVFSLSSWAKSHGADDRMIFIDFFCHGTPSKLLWDSYTKSVKSKLHTDSFGKIDFRTKAQGWHEYSCVFYDSESKNSITSPKTIKDFFYTVFFDDQILNEACYTCKFRDNFTNDDIRFGDFWGKKYEKNDTGVSVVLVCSEKGQNLWDKVQSTLTIEDADYSEIVGEEPLNDMKYSAEKREATLNLLRSGCADLGKYTKLYSAKKKIFRKLKIIAGSMPKPLMLFIKRLYRKLK